MPPVFTARGNLVAKLVAIAFVALLILGGGGVLQAKKAASTHHPLSNDMAAADTTRIAAAPRNAPRQFA